jgi:hypothetical protein
VTTKAAQTRRSDGIRYIPTNITEDGGYGSSGLAWVPLALVPRLPYPNFLRQSCPEIGEYDDLESSKNSRSASWHGNQHVRLRGAQIKSIAAPTRLKDHQDSGGAVGAAVVVLQRGLSQDFSQGRRKEGCRRECAAFIQHTEDEILAAGATEARIRPRAWPGRTFCRRVRRN